MLAFSMACERNRDPILAVLRRSFAGCTDILEIGSGTGQHAVYFAAGLGFLAWHPTERAQCLGDLTARIAAEGGANLRPPLALDVTQKVWPVASADGVFTANTLHIMSWPEVTELFRGVGTVLAERAVLCIYGPFRYQGRYTSASNRAFDEQLKSGNLASGLREIDDVVGLAEGIGLTLRADHDLPANNRLLEFVR
jgi:SAM-dependent methyltransferase